MTARRPSTRGVLAMIAVAVTLGACAGNAGTATSPDGSTTGGPPAGSPTEPSTEPPSVTQADGVQPEGFSTVTARITDPDGEVCDVCLWLADDAAERGRGLMGVTDLGDAAGMAFRFDDARLGSFYMFQTPTPLSIAWFDPEGDFVGSADMAPCLDTPAEDCPLYSPNLEYDLAIEVFEGGLEGLGLVSGSSVELLAGSEAERCPGAP